MTRYYTEVLYESPKINEPETSHVVYKACDVEPLIKALKYLVYETEDYIKINNLGALNNQSLKMARAAIAKLERSPS